MPDPDIDSEERDMAIRGLTKRIPIWVKVSGIIVLVLVGVVASSMLLGGIGSGDAMQRGGRHGGGSGTQRDDGGQHDSGDATERGGGHGSGDATERGGGHGSGDATEGTHHSRGQPSSIAPSERDLAGAQPQAVPVAMEDSLALEPAETRAQCGAIAGLELENTRALLHDVASDDVPIEAMRVEGGRP